jgi:hypothetical protein
MTMEFAGARKMENRDLVAYFNQCNFISFYVEIYVLNVLFYPSLKNEHSLGLKLT